MTYTEVFPYYTKDKVKVGDFIARTGGGNTITIGLYAAGELPEVIKVGSGSSGMVVKQVRSNIVYA